MDLAKIPPKFQLQPLDLVAPGFRGINTAQAAALLHPGYATEAMNAVIDAAGRLAARDGITNITSTVTEDEEPIRTIFEYRTGTGDSEMIVAWDGGLSGDTNDPDSADLSGSVNVSNGTWLFQNFNNKVLGFQAGQKVIVYNGTGTFAEVTESSGTAPEGGVGLAAFGRVWQTQVDGQTIQYSALLDETAWHADDGAGLIDMRTIWTNGTDTVMALAAFNGALVVFGRNHVVFFVDGKGSALGLDPENIYVTDVIGGIGTVSQFTVQQVGETDLLFLSASGVQSIKRLIAERSAPVASLTKYVRDDLLADLRRSDITNVRSVYSPQFGFYLLSFPEAGIVWCIDQRRRYQDAEGAECAVVTKWNLSLTAMASLMSGALYVARTAGKVGQYLGDTDEGSPFRFIFLSPWLDLGEEIGNRLKILKRLGAILFVRNQTIVTFKWFVDFSTDFKSAQKSLAGDAAAEYGTAEYGEDEYSGGLALRILKPPARGVGQYFRIGIEADVSGEFALQQAELFAKIGRLA